MNFSIVIPAYNEAASIGKVLAALEQHVPEAEILVVDDCSTDNTCEVIRGFSHVTLIRQKVNQGPIPAIAAGIEASSHPVIVTIDADGQHPADAVKSIAAPVLDGRADLVLGVRDHLPRLGEVIIARIAGVRDATTGLKAMRKELGGVMEQDFVYGGVLVAEARQRQMRVLEVPITVKERTAGASVHSDWNILKKALLFGLWRARQAVLR